MPEGKWNAYEHDLRIPMIIAGPGIPASASFDFIASNVDTMPTVFGLVGVPTPPSMDGRSFAHLLLNDLDEAPRPARDLILQVNDATNAAPAPWRTEQLIEYGGGGPVVRYEHLEDIHNNTFRCLRVIDSRPSSTIRNVKLCEFVGWTDWVSICAPHQVRVGAKAMDYRSASDACLCYAEQQNFTSGGANSEWELFDLEQDP